MLKLRIATAAVLIPTVLYILFAASPAVFRFATAVIICLAAWEWPTLMGKKDLFMRMGYVLLVVAFLFISHLLNYNVILFISALGWVAYSYWVVNYPAKQEHWLSHWKLGAIGIHVLVPCYVALNFLHELPYAKELLFILLLLIWGADTSAYFIGKRFGRNKLIPAVSPNKSWQGFYAALVSGFLVALMAIIWLNEIFAGHKLSFIFIALLTVLASVIGDLNESMLKRAQGVKDSGNMLPGHGGILDRIDSLTAAAPIYSLGIMLLGFN